MLIFFSSVPKCEISRVYKGLEMWVKSETLVFTAVIANADESNITSTEIDLTEKLEVAFLQDIQNYPESGIAERYKRLGISVRQGQKIKNRTLKDELIEEHIETVRTGRIKIIRLTEKALSFLSKNR